MKNILLSICCTMVFIVVFAENSIAQSDVKKWQETEQIDGQEVRVLKMSKPFEKTVDLTSEDDNAEFCEVNIATDYWQQDTLVKVEATIENSQCDASSGQYVVKVRTRNADDEATTATYPESWVREDANTIKAVHTYSMNGDTELIRVRIKFPLNDSCVCLK